MGAYTKDDEAETAQQTYRRMLRDEWRQLSARWDSRDRARITDSQTRRTKPG